MKNPCTMGSTVRSTPARRGDRSGGSTARTSSVILAAAVARTAGRRDPAAPRRASGNCCLSRRRRRCTACPRRRVAAIRATAAADGSASGQRRAASVSLTMATGGLPRVVGVREGTPGDDRRLHDVEEAGADDEEGDGRRRRSPAGDCFARVDANERRRAVERRARRHSRRLDVGQCRGFPDDLFEQRQRLPAGPSTDCADVEGDDSTRFETEADRACATHAAR